MEACIPGVELLESMIRIRRVEEALSARYSEQEMRCPMHLCVGQEAIAVGVSAHLSVEDAVFSNHRAHGHYLAKGGDLGAMIAELYGKKEGCCGGRGGSMHLIDLTVGFLGATPIVGGTIPLAVGAAWASKLKRSDNVTIVYFGDGCFEEGVMHESLNFAALHKLPIIFVCENNQFSVYTRLDERQPDRPLHKISEAHGIHSVQVDGNDVEKVWSVTAEIIRRIKRVSQPIFIECETYRWLEHCGPDFDNDLGYRSEMEVQKGMELCPILRQLQRLKSRSLIDDNELQLMEKKIKEEIDEAFRFANESEAPSTEDGLKFVYAQ